MIKEYGPYEIKGRLFMHIRNTTTGKNTTISYPKWLYEHKVRKLLSNEVVHHIDDNPLNNNLSNLEIKTRRKHTSDHRIQRGTPMYEFTCPNCNAEAEIAYSTYNKVQIKRGSPGPFCSRSCATQFRYRS